MALLFGSWFIYLIILWLAGFLVAVYSDGRFLVAVLRAVTLGQEMLFE